MKPVPTSHDFLNSIGIKIIHDSKPLLQLEETLQTRKCLLCVRERDGFGLRRLVGEVHRSWHKDKAIAKGAEGVSAGGEGMRAGW